MSASVSLSGPLADLRKAGCAYCSAHPNALGSELGPLAVAERWRLAARRRCNRCEFLILLQAIDNLVPEEEVEDWLKEPNVDLGGRTPMECIDAADYEPLFTAICLLNPGGPVS